MAIKIGTNDVVDKFVGSQLVERAYKGTDLIFDAYSEVDGSLPLTFDSRAEHALTDYTIYGTSAGAGAQTAQLFNKNATDTANGYVDGEYLSGTNSTTANSSYAISEYIPVSASTEYFLKNAVNASDQYRRLVFYNSSKTGLSNLRYRDTGSPNDFSFTTPENCAFVRISFVIDFAADISLTLFAAAEYIPFGYQIPLSITDGTNTEDYVLYIGDTQLGENEYLDYSEQKLYKDVSGTLTPTDPPAAFPAIIAYAGENTLSSTETVGSVTIKGRIKETT